MARPRSSVPTLIELPSGQKVSASCKAMTDWAAVRMMVESGVPMGETAKLFKISHQTVKDMSYKEKWLTPTRVEKLKKEMVALQRHMFDSTGQTMDAVALKALLWEERGERWKEKAAEIVDGALHGVSKRTMKGMITEAKDLTAVVDLARKLTGETAAEDNAPKLAVSIGFLRSNTAPRQVPIDVDSIDVSVEG